jgi:hypothetical protein
MPSQRLLRRRRSRGTLGPVDIVSHSHYRGAVRIVSYSTVGIKRMLSGIAAKIPGAYFEHPICKRKNIGPRLH